MTGGGEYTDIAKALLDDTTKPAVQSTGYSQAIGGSTLSGAYTQFPPYFTPVNPNGTLGGSGGANSGYNTWSYIPANTADKEPEPKKNIFKEFPDKKPRSKYETRLGGFQVFINNEWAERIFSSLKDNKSIAPEIIGMIMGKMKPFYIIEKCDYCGKSLKTADMTPLRVDVYQHGKLHKACKLIVDAARKGKKEGEEVNL